jgi:hypothetical protein
MSRKKSPAALKLQENKAIQAGIRLSDLGFENVMETDSKMLIFIDKDFEVVYWPLSEWFSGPSVKDGRGFKNLLNQLNKK